MTMGGPETVFGMRYCTYIWSVMMLPGGAAPVAGESGNWVAAAWPLTKKEPSSWSSSGPPSEPAAAAVMMPAVKPAASKVFVVQRFGFALMMTSSQELRSRNDCVQRSDGRQRRCRLRPTKPRLIARKDSCRLAGSHLRNLEYRRCEQFLDGRLAIDQALLVGIAGQRLDLRKIFVNAVAPKVLA